MNTILAPMEGVFDVYFRDLFTRIGGYDLCVTEFIRVSDRLLSRSCFRRYCPELDHGGKTASGVPVFIQLMGGHAELLAENGYRAYELGAPGVDLNFGCPAKVVNRHNAGSKLLESPEQIYRITAAVRNAVPKTIPVTAKIRLGYKDTSLVFENSLAVEEAGASFMTVHARTKAQGYRPPAHWEWLAKIRERVKIPIVANGDIESLSDYKRCLEISGCDSVMVGRGAFSYPELGLEIQRDNQGEPFTPKAWVEVKQMAVDFFLSLSEKTSDAYMATRTKQWFRILAKKYPEAETVFDQIKREKSVENILRHLRQSVENDKVD